MPYTQVANLDFEDIKVALKDYMRAQTEFTDYDFEGSALSNLIDVLAYNTYYTAFNTNMVVNELFIDSATLRDNVVALAKQLGYTPKSITAPTAYISFTVTYDNPTTDTELFLKRDLDLQQHMMAPYTSMLLLKMQRHRYQTIKQYLRMFLLEREHYLLVRLL